MAKLLFSEDMMWNLTNEHYHPEGFRWRVECSGDHHQLIAARDHAEEMSLIHRISFTYRGSPWYMDVASGAVFFFKRERDMMLFHLYNGEIVVKTRYCHTRQKYEADERKRIRKNKEQLKKSRKKMS